MGRAFQWILLFLTASASSITINVVGNDERADRKLANIEYSGVISIDCGANEGYTDKMTNMPYQADDNMVVQFGEIHNVSPDYTFDNFSQIAKQLSTLRSFPEGGRNCYTLKPKQGKNNKYLMRAYFVYGNYDNKNELPIFYLHIGVNAFARLSLNTNTASYVSRIDGIHFISTDTIDYCLVNSNDGVPFISLLELWPLDNSVYQTSSTLLPLTLEARVNLGASVDTNLFIRYTDDIYGRSWSIRESFNKNPKKTSSAIDLDKLDDPYKLPAEVLSTAVEALNLSNSLNFTTNLNTDYEYYVYLHFFDFEDRENNQKRIMEISINGLGDAVTQLLITLAYWKPRSIVIPIKKGMGISNILIEATSHSNLPAMLNAFEIFSVVRQPNSATQQEDVDTIRKIKKIYNISKISWQGDPCGPMSFTWEGLTCNDGDNPRIISLNLSSSKLSGEIDASFSNLTYLEILDLSNNELTGEVPEFFAELPRLKILNLSSNKLTGSIPESLKAKSNTSLQLSLDGNLGLNQTVGSYESNDHESIVPLVASIVASVAALIIVVIVMVIWRLKKNGRDSSKKDEQLKTKNQAFHYSEVLSITNNFNTMIGKGGFGKVYLGILQGGKRVAVKILSLSSMQGYKEFKSEAKLLMLVHHRNVVSLVGYCDEGDIKALIYEYLSRGNLQKQLSDNNPNILEWNERLKIALDAANGLDYLHNGCKPAIIHRDIKPSNILLDENMHAKISDFGLSRTFANDIDTHISTSYPAGTPGYLDPEFHSSGILNKKSDVYSFGIVLLELITGQPAIRGTPNNGSHILPWVNLKLESGDIQAIVDPRLQGKYNTASAWKFIEIALSCLPSVAIQRPDVSHIASELKDCLSLEISLERSMSNKRNPYIQGSIQIEFNESDVGPNPR